MRNDNRNEVLMAMKVINSMKAITGVMAMIASVTCSPIFGRNYYVSGTGMDEQNGTTTAQAFRTLRKAATLVNPGDTVWIGGDYTTSTSAGGGVRLTRSGTAAAWIVWKTMPGAHPDIVYEAWGGITINASYQAFEGLTVTGNKDNVTLAQAEADYEKGSADGRYNGNGISVDTRNSQIKWHHIRLTGCTIRKNCGAGVAAIGSDYVTVEDCLIYENAWYSRFGCSGASFLTSIAADAAPGYHMILRRNKVWNNRGLVKWKEIGKLSDGNGIIIDYNLPAGYTGSFLVANNVCFNNGGSGIHSYNSANVDIVNNTSYGNAQVVDYPSLYAQDSKNVRILNNIIHADAGKQTNSNTRNTSVTYDYNIYFGGKAPAVRGAHDRVLDPGFVNASKDPLTADFRIRAGSAAIDAGTAFPALLEDQAKSPRIQGSQIDIGAFEFANGVLIRAGLGLGQTSVTESAAAYFDLRGRKIVFSLRLQSPESRSLRIRP
jgi:hypothetical protein